MKAEIFNNPLEFNPDRYENNESPRVNNSIYSPFGVGPRKCPASGTFSKNFWIGTMKGIFAKHALILEGDLRMEDIPVDVAYVTLTKQYRGTLSDKKALKYGANDEAYREGSELFQRGSNRPTKKKS